MTALAAWSAVAAGSPGPSLPSPPMISRRRRSADHRHPARCPPASGGPGMHEHQLAATARVAAGAGEPECETRRFGALRPGPEALAAWPAPHDIEAAVMEGTGVSGVPPPGPAARGRVEAHQVTHVRGRKTDLEDNRWPARVCLFASRACDTLSGGLSGARRIVFAPVRGYRHPVRTGGLARPGGRRRFGCCATRVPGRGAASIPPAE